MLSILLQSTAPYEWLKNTGYQPGLRAYLAFLREGEWALPGQVVRGPLPLIFISRNPQSVAFHGGHLVRAAPRPNGSCEREKRNAQQRSNVP